MDDSEIVKILYSALCIDPRAYGVSPDSKGYVCIDILLDNIFRKDSVIIDDKDLKRLSSTFKDVQIEMRDRAIRITYKPQALA